VVDSANQFLFERRKCRMTVQQLIDKLNEIENKELTVTIFDHEYRDNYELEDVVVRKVPNDEFYHFSGQEIIELDG
jgi:hypothetical protein